MVHLHHAEAVSGRRFHHPPAVDELDLLRAQRFQACGFGIDVIGFDVQVHARGMVDFLHFDVQVGRRIAKLLVSTGHIAGVGIGDRQAQRLAPELRGGIEVTSTFHVGPAGFIDFEVVAGSVGREQLGRRLQRVLDAETYRTMALVGLPLARRIGPELTALEDGLAEVTEMLSTRVGSDAEILERLQSLSAETEAMRAKTRYRFSASRAYATLVEERLASMAATS